ncbi:putative ABC transporter permease subunit [Tundrisphaera lichenicola]|uniref:putative ABC transporter permease subunit n=1 Tax=Tundrisphaera lichenicola TaxID=2029860 RepID=UPI003EB89F6D
MTRLDGPIPPRLSTPRQVGSAFRFLRWRLGSNGLHLLLTGSRLRLSMIVICSAIFWSGLFFLFFGGFHFIKSFIPNLAGEFVEYIFSMFFLSLLVMLIFSAGIILYTGLFQSREAAYLLTTPASPDRIFAYKYFEAIAYSSWAFLLLGSPLMVSFGIVEDASWGFYAIFPLFFLAFVLIPGSLGAVGALLVATILPRRQKTILGLLAGLILLGLIAFGLRIWQTPGELLTSDWLDGLLGRLEFSRNPLWPSRWMSVGLVASVRGDWPTSLFYLMVVTAHAGLAYLIAAVVARDLYRLGYGRIQGGRSSRRRFGWYGFDTFFHRVFFFLPNPIRLLILKDLRTFRRDPAQWSQFLIFFGLLAFYFINIRRLSYDVQKPYWRNLISFLNLSVTALILSTFTSRFIFPLLSLEGRNFWVLGLLPLKRESILWGKFAFSSGISLVSTEILVVLSDLMLRMGPGMILLHMGMVAILCFGLSGISVGLGARLPNLKEDDPSKIAAGFGGTLNLLVSLVFICAIVTALAVPCHLYFAGQDNPEFAGISLSATQFRFWLGVAIMTSLVVGIVGTVVPLRIGIKAFQRMEF